MSERIRKLLLEARHKSLRLGKLELWKAGNARKTQILENIEELAQNIKATGVQVPLVVKEEIPDQKYLVISGQRRLLACRMIHYDSPIPCIVLKDVSREDALILSLSENLYRQPMNDDDLSDACDYLYNKFGTLSIVAERLGVSTQRVRRYLGYKHTPEQIKELVRGNKLNVSQAVEIYSHYQTPEKQIKVAKELAKIEDRLYKSKFYQAVKETPRTAHIPEIHKEAERLRALKPYNIRLPPKSSQLVERVAAERGVSGAEIVVEIIEWWTAEYEAGRLTRLGRINE